MAYDEGRWSSSDRDIILIFYLVSTCFSFDLNKDCPGDAHHLVEGLLRSRAVLLVLDTAVSTKTMQIRLCNTKSRNLVASLLVVCLDDNLD